jgi:FkbM family methyltransferase
VSHPVRVQIAPIARLVRRGLLAFDYELMLEDTYRSFLRQGDFVVDVGAHSGRHLFNFAQLVGSFGGVAGFEPIPDKFTYLNERARDLGFTNLKLYNLALTNFEGTSSFIHAVGTPEESGLKARAFNAPERAQPTTIEVKVSTLDTVLGDIERLDYIKIDIEGGELDCLAGASCLIGKFRPFISVEFGRPGYSAYGKTPYDLLRYTHALDYHIFDIFCIEYVTDQDFIENVDGFFWDFFLVPNEKRPLFCELTS